MNTERFVISDEVWARIAPRLPGKSSDCGVTAADNRLFLESVLWRVRTGSPWRDLPLLFGNWNSVFRRFRRRMIEDMNIRGFAIKTQTGYLRAVRDFAAFLGRPPDRADGEELRRYQLHMRSNGASATSINAAVSALRFFFGVTLGRGDAQVGITTVREPRKLPVVLSPNEVTRLLDAAPGLKYRAAFSIAYGTGLRASEVISLKIGDIDSERGSQPRAPPPRIRTGTS